MRGLCTVRCSEWRFLSVQRMVCVRCQDSCSLERACLTALPDPNTRKYELKTSLLSCPALPCQTIPKYSESTGRVPCVAVRRPVQAAEAGHDSPRLKRPFAMLLNPLCPLCAVDERDHSPTRCPFQKYDTTIIPNCIIWILYRLKAVTHHDETIIFTGVLHPQNNIRHALL